MFSESTFGYYIVGIAGQSNAHGWSVGLDPNLDYPDPRILQLANSGPNNDRVILANDPLSHKGGARANEIGFAMSFARLFLPTIPPSKKLLLLPCAVGGTGFSENNWNPNNELAQNYKNQIQKALALPGDHRFVGTLWHQGESDTDSATEAVNYPTQIKTLIEFIRSIPGAENSLFVVGEMAPTWVIEDPDREAVQQHLRNLPGFIPYTACVSSQGLLTHDGIHFDAASERALGERYFYGLVSASLNLPKQPSIRRPPKFSDSSPITPPPPTIPNDGLPPAIFRFNFSSGAAVDISGNNRSLILIAPALITDSPGRGKTLKAVDGGRADVAIAPPANYTKAAWLWTPNLGVNGNIISSDAIPDHVFWSPGTDGIMSAGHNGNFTVVFESSTLPTSQWVHYAVTYERATNTMKMFRNGVKTAQSTSSPIFEGGTSPTRIGYYAEAQNTFDSYLDKPAMWGVVLSEAQILALYNAEKSP
jgi:hypothetical protein